MKHWIGAVVVCFGISTASGQVMVEYGAAAGLSGTVGSGAGKKVGDGVGGILGRTAGRLDQAARGADSSASSSSRIARTERASVAQSSAVSVPAKLLTADDLKGIKVGMARAEVVAKLGAPASTMTIPDDDGLVEVMRYNGAAQELARIRLVNGSVATVKPSAP